MLDRTSASSSVRELEDYFNINVAHRRVDVRPPSVIPPRALQAVARLQKDPQSLRQFRPCLPTGRSRPLLSESADLPSATVEHSVELPLNARWKELRQPFCSPPRDAFFFAQQKQQRGIPDDQEEVLSVTKGSDGLYRPPLRRRKSNGRDTTSFSATQNEIEGAGRQNATWNPPTSDGGSAKWELTTEYNYPMLNDHPRSFTDRLSQRLRTPQAGVTAPLPVTKQRRFMVESWTPRGGISTKDATAFPHRSLSPNTRRHSRREPPHEPCAPPPLPTIAGGTKETDATAGRGVPSTTHHSEERGQTQNFRTVVPLREGLEQSPTPYQPPTLTILSEKEDGEFGSYAVHIDGNLSALPIFVLKQALEPYIEIKASEQLLTHDGTVLQNEAKAGDYNIREGGVVYLHTERSPLLQPRQENGRLSFSPTSAQYVDNVWPAIWHRPIVGLVSPPAGRF